MYGYRFAIDVRNSLRRSRGMAHSGLEPEPAFLRKPMDNFDRSQKKLLIGLRSYQSVFDLMLSNIRGELLRKGINGKMESMPISVACRVKSKVGAIFRKSFASACKFI